MHKNAIYNELNLHGGGVFVPKVMTVAVIDINIVI